MRGDTERLSGKCTVLRAGDGTRGPGPGPSRNIPHALRVYSALIQCSDRPGYSTRSGTLLTED
jgi:hypothetical protein